MMCTSNDAKRKTYWKTTTVSPGTYGGKWRPERAKNLCKGLWMGYLQKQTWISQRNSVRKVFYMLLHSLLLVTTRYSVRDHQQKGSWLGCWWTGTSSRRQDHILQLPCCDEAKSWNSRSPKYTWYHNIYPQRVCWMVNEAESGYHSK